MADINSLSFGCGETLLAGQLNIMADAIRSLITLVGTIGDQVGNYIPLSGSENITGVLAPNINEGHDLGKSNKRWATVWASTGGFKVIDFYDLQSPYGKLGRLEINQDGKLQYDGEPLALLSDINNEINNDNQSFIHFGQNVRGRLDENYVRIPTSLKLDDVDDNEEAISNNYYNLYCGGINIKGTKFIQRGNYRFEEDDGEEHHTLCVRDGELLFDGNPIGSNPQLGNVLEGINELDLPESSKYLYYNYNNLSFEWANGTGGGVSYDSTDDRGKYLKVKNDGNGTEWSDISLSDLSNTEIGGLNNALSNGLVLVYDSSLSRWKNASLSANLPSVSGHGGEYLKVKNDGTLAEWTSVAPGSGLTGIKYQTTGSATEITPSSGYVTLKAGNNVSFTPSTDGVIEISASGGGSGVTNVKINDLSVVTNNIANIPLASNSDFGVVKIGVYGGLTLDNNGFLKLNATNVGQNKTGLFLVTDAGSTLSYSWVEVDLSNPANGNALIYDNGVWTCGNIIPTKNSNTNGYLKSTAGVLSWSPGSYTLPTATDSALGGIKIGYSESNSGSNTNRNYAVKLDSNNKAYVNVPWTASNLTLSGLVGSSSIGGQTTPIYWNGSTFQTCDTQTSGITSIAVGTPSLLLTPSSGSVTIPSLTSSNSTEYGVIKANGSFNAPNYPVKTNNSGSAYITLAIDDLMGSNAVGNSTTPIYWTGSAFSTCNTSTGGEVDNTLLNTLITKINSSYNSGMIIGTTLSNSLIDSITNIITQPTFKDTGYYILKGTFNVTTQGGAKLFVNPLFRIDTYSNTLQLVVNDISNPTYIYCAPAFNTNSLSDLYGLDSINDPKDPPYKLSTYIISLLDEKYNIKSFTNRGSSYPADYLYSPGSSLPNINSIKYYIEPNNTSSTAIQITS